MEGRTHLWVAPHFGPKCRRFGPWQNVRPAGTTPGRRPGTRLSEAQEAGSRCAKFPSAGHDTGGLTAQPRAQPSRRQATPCGCWVASPGRVRLSLSSCRAVRELEGSS